MPVQRRRLLAWAESNGFTVKEGGEHHKICLAGYRPYPIGRGKAYAELSDFWLKAFCRNFELNYDTVQDEVK